MPASPELPRIPTAPAPSRWQKAGELIARARFLYLPLGLFALLAVGIHAGADTLDDRILWVVDHLDAAFDAVVGRFSWTASWVHWVDLDDRVRIARSLALAWELVADALLAFPLLTVFDAQPPTGVLNTWLGGPPAEVLERLKNLVRRPTLLRVTRPVCAFGVVLAGACSVGKMVQGSLYLGARGLLGDGAAGMIARILAVAALLAVLGTLGVRAVLGHLARADLQAHREERLHPLRARTRGLFGTLIIAPLAVAALLGATPFLSFFR